MQVDIILCDGRRYALPQLITWETVHGLGQPCDSMDLSCAFDREMAQVLPKAYRVAASHEGETVFYGPLDEWEARINGSGAVLSLSARGMAALLMDNEAEAVEFGTVRAEEILKSYVKVFGITDIESDNIDAITGFSVKSGDCAWNILYRFTRMSAGITPRFSRSGKLIIASGPGKSYLINEKTAVYDIRRRERRYGLVSQVLVKNSVRGTAETVKNEEFIERGGSCRRVLNVPRYTGGDAMRYTGEFQIQESRRGKDTVELTLPGLFAAEPNDIIALTRPELGLSGTWRVREGRCFGGESGAGTTLTLEKMEG